MYSRETIWAALAAKLGELVVTLPGPPTTSQPLMTFSRKWRHYKDVTEKEMPAMFQVQLRETEEVIIGRLTKLSMIGELMIYASTVPTDTTSGQDWAASMVYNPIVDVVQNMLVPENDTPQTLGRVVERCAINGEITYHDPVQDTVAIVLIPIEIICGKSTTA